MKKFIFFTPLIIIFLILSMLLFALLSQNIGNKKTINSVLLNKPIPTKTLLSLNLNEPIDLEMYSGSPFLVNFFSSWCEPCKLEASNLEKLSEKIPIIGISYKDQKEDTYLFLDKYGNPYDEISYDSDGNIAINWGVYGVPETFIIDKNGIIIIDNVLWHGEVADNSKNDKFTNIIREFNKYIKDDNRVIKNIIPIGDGLTICIKK